MKNEPPCNGAFEGRPAMVALYVVRSTMECYSCKSLSGERPISPGPAIYEGEYWIVEHAYPVGMKGWLVIVLKRHAEALHKLGAEEFSELAGLLEKSSNALHAVLGCQKEYLACFGEAEHFNHMHVHVIARAHNLPAERKGPGIFELLRVSEDEAVAPDEIRAFCEEMQGYFS